MKSLLRANTQKKYRKIKTKFYAFSFFSFTKFCIGAVQVLRKHYRGGGEVQGSGSTYFSDKGEGCHENSYVSIRQQIKYSGTTTSKQSMRAE